MTQSATRELRQKARRLRDDLERHADEPGVMGVIAELSAELSVLVDRVIYPVVQQIHEENKEEDACPRTKEDES